MTPVDSPHLADARLLACYLAEGDTGHLLPAELSALAHLRRCEGCARRFERIRWEVERLREDDRSEQRELFTPEYFEAQRAQVLRRIEHLGQHARVLTFPAHARKGPRPVPSNTFGRWVAAAAAAGLAVGLGLGALMNFQLQLPWSSAGKVAVTTPRPAAKSSHQAAVATLSDPAFNDEAFLSEIEQAVAGQRAAELEALDALTPHVRETSTRR